MSSDPPRFPVFPLSCWALGLMAFAQLLVAGLALAERFENSKQVRTVVKEVPKFVAVRVPVPQPAPEAAQRVVSRPPMPSFDEVNPLPPPSPVRTPAIADPRTERLVREARSARVAGDMDAAILKLEEAQNFSPDDANVHYELGLVHEQMGVFDIASDHYSKVFQMGVGGAGALYELAAKKLGEGFEQPNAMLGKLSLGRVRRFPDQRSEAGERVILTIPVQKAPGVEIEKIDDINVVVVFFNRTSKGEIVQLEDQNWVKDRWVSLPFDWAGGEESVQMTYTIPPRDPATEHLFGELKYYGQVVSLLYRGEVLDVQAWPPNLAARIPQQAVGPGDPQQPEFEDVLPPEFDPNLPLLPPLPSH